MNPNDFITVARFELNKAVREQHNVFTEAVLNGFDDLLYEAPSAVIKWIELNQDKIKGHSAMFTCMAMLLEINSIRGKKQRRTKK